MSGYILIEQSQLAPYKEDGFEQSRDLLGFIDFLRELSEKPWSFERFARVQVIGLDTVLFAAKPYDRELAFEIHRRLQHAAPDLQKNLLTIVVVFQEKLTRGNTLWADYRGTQLPIDVIFDSPPHSSDSRGNYWYSAHFNLTSPSA